MYGFARVLLGTGIELYSRKGRYNYNLQNILFLCFLPFSISRAYSLDYCAPLPCLRDRYPPHVVVTIQCMLFVIRMSLLFASLFAAFSLLCVCVCVAKQLCLTFLFEQKNMNNATADVGR